MAHLPQGGEVPGGWPTSVSEAVDRLIAALAPEQLEGKEADARADLWALGCVLYEMATGARAFAGIKLFARRSPLSFFWGVVALLLMRTADIARSDRERGYLALHVAILVAMIYHTYSWFEIMPKTMPMIFVGLPLASISKRMRK